MTNYYNGEVALVTGGTGNIGQKIVKRLVDDRLKVAFTYYKQQQVAKSIVKELGGPDRVLAIQDKEGTLEQAYAIVDKIKQHWGPVHFLVNNAGLIRDCAFLNMAEEDWQKVLSVNLEKTLAFSRAIIFDAMKYKQGVIVNMSSIAALAGSHGQVNYAAAKAGVIGMTRALALEVARHRIRVNAIAPGYIESAMVDSMKDQVKEKALNLIPIARFGKPEEIASATAFLLSEGAAYITGQTLVVDGGLVM